MAVNKHTTTKDPEKTVDVPPYGSRNPDPITDTAGSHPVETGIGAVIGGVASGLAVGTLTGGPIGAVIGAIAGGAAAGGLAGKGVGELIDPTTEDNWLREYYESSKTTTTSSKKSAADTDDHLERYRPAVRYGAEASSKTAGTARTFDQAETDLRSEWEQTHAKNTGMDWTSARGAVRHAYDRTLELHEQRLSVDKHQQSAGDVEVRKEVITEHKTVQVPVEREEVVITRKPVGGKAAAGDIRAEEIRIPVKEEVIDVRKETVVKEEVTVGKRKVTDTKTVEADLKREEVKVENNTTGSARVVDERKKK